MNKQYLVLFSVVLSSQLCAMHSELSATRAAQKLLSLRTFSTTQKPSQPRIPAFVNTIKKFGLLDPQINKITYAPNHPLTESSREKVFSGTPDGIVQEAYELITVTDTKNGYERTFKSITLREGKCTQDNCFQQTIGILSDTNTLKLPTKNVAPEVKRREVEYGILETQKFESVAVDCTKDTPAVVSACKNCEKIVAICRQLPSADADKIL